MLERIIIFILALLLLFLSSWTYSVFLRLDKENKNKIPTCSPSPDYIKRGKIFGLIFVVTSALLVVTSAGWLFIQRKRK